MKKIKWVKHLLSKNFAENQGKEKALDGVGCNKGLYRNGKKKPSRAD
jgi:hypothetical protein